MGKKRQTKGNATPFINGEKERAVSLPKGREKTSTMVPRSGKKRGATIRKRPRSLAKRIEQPARNKRVIFEDDFHQKGEREGKKDSSILWDRKGRRRKEGPYDMFNGGKYNPGKERLPDFPKKGVGVGFMKDESSKG